MHKPLTSIDYLINVVRNLFQIIHHLSFETYIFTYQNRN